MNISNHSTVDGNRYFLHDHPILIYVGLGKEKAGLDHEKEHVKETNQVLPLSFHRMKPESINDSPGKDIAVILSHYSARLFQEAYFFSEE